MNKNYLNGTEIKKLIRSKGFLPGNSYGRITLILPNTKMVQNVDNNRIIWLQALDDVVVLSMPFPGIHVGDSVQIFSDLNDFAYWSKTAKVKQLLDDKEFGRMAIVVMPDGKMPTLFVRELVVIARDGVVDLTKMTKEEREAAVLAMMG